MNLSFRYFVIAEMIVSVSPFFDLLKPELKTIYPMQFSFVANSTINTYMNICFQATCLFYSSSLFYHIFLIITVIIINVLTELKVIANLCRLVGDAEKGLTKQEQNEGSLRTNILEGITKELDNECKESKITCVATSKLLRTLLKYHSNIIS